MELCGYLKDKNQKTLFEITVETTKSNNGFLLSTLFSFVDVTDWDKTYNSEHKVRVQARGQSSNFWIG